MEKLHPCFKDGTIMKKWHRVFWVHIYHFSFTRSQARKAIKMNPYLAKHEKDLERVFDEAHFIPDEWERAWALDRYQEYIDERAKENAKR